jgi:hypothetical protein
MHLIDQLELSRRCHLDAPVSLPPQKEHAVPKGYETGLIHRAILDAREKFRSPSGIELRFRDLAECHLGAVMTELSLLILK